ncbi:DUF4962 domain-containing protein [Rhodophyticola sp. CCM32]|uniref:DUF4962 domain-containing protein n=1 Tax=Rhodophyticola sp. CCM32 TaxID=2916397 RepID=UPI00107F8C02|nr:DUF4962 domain-containing protein [Rhodophyticola sp. CCM32]QBX99449.1 DUF4962 domain-containing protein [Rhodophyticola sp. CCM32]
MPSAAKLPSALPGLEAPEAGRLTVKYAPEDGPVVENPPRFSWLPAGEGVAAYVLRVSADPDFPAGQTWCFTGLPLNFFTPDMVFPPGAYHWSYAVWSPATAGPASAWSISRRFTIPLGLPQTPLPSRTDRYLAAPKTHPRLWLCSDQVAAFRKAVAEDQTHCAWQVFFEKSVTPWMARDILPEPTGYPDGKRSAPIWRQTYIDCQEVLYAIRHLAIGSRITGDDAMQARARDWLLSVAAWSPTGSTARSYTDEWAFRVTVALAWGYDWLHDDLTGADRNLVREALLIRTREIAEHIIHHTALHRLPFDSHAVRAVSAVLVPACIALMDEVPEARGWLDYAIEFLATLYSPWGDVQGGWAEGPHYWMTGMASLTEAATLLKSFMGYDLFQRPFFQHTADFPLYAKAPDTRRGTFGDDSTLGDTVCLKLGHIMRQFAGVTGNGVYQWYCDQVIAADPGTEMMFYNYGWWDLNFDQMTCLHDYGHVTAIPPADIDRLRCFKGIGWACIQHRMAEPDRHIQFNFKSSPFGSVSHSHGDQNAFCLSGFGEDLAVQSGHYIAFNSSMHKVWRRQTRSKNAILINGKGQYAGDDKAMAMASTGRIVTAEDRSDHIFIRGDATQAYRALSPEVTSVLRDIYFIHDRYFVIVDAIEADTEVTIDWLLHANAPMELGDDRFCYSGKSAGFYGQCLWSEAGAPVLTQEVGFPGVDPAEIKGLPVSTCLHATYPKATRHRIATLLVPYPLVRPYRVVSRFDVQNDGCDLHFSDAADQRFKVRVSKAAGIHG